MDFFSETNENNVHVKNLLVIFILIMAKYWFGSSFSQESPENQPHIWLIAMV